MNYPSIVVCLDNRASSNLQLEFAVRLASQHRAHLTALHLSHPPLESFITFGAYAEIPVVALEWERMVAENQQKSKTNFTNLAQQAGLNFDWECYRGNEIKEVSARARVADISIVGQVYSDYIDTDISSDFYTQFAINLGKPVLFLPNNITDNISTAFKTIIVAWDGGRESARAMADALPFLKAANLVHVITVATTKDPDKELPDVNVATFLSRHGVKVAIDRVDNINIDAAELTLIRASELKANLIVMGAFGHSRFSEFILGGMTRTMMQTMPLPVLMSH